MAGNPPPYTPLKEDYQSPPQGYHLDTVLHTIKGTLLHLHHKGIHHRNSRLPASTMIVVNNQLHWPQQTTQSSSQPQPPDRLYAKPTKPHKKKPNIAVNGAIKTENTFTWPLGTETFVSHY
ncbi:hypothetical protein BSL78_13943 [Apostichopus japonicus]|uniref:Uncharacterized protein n=1 Tax=Stichopus japonicus TaxID=307972 RepID=A0A2G8KMC1_STIJA|nr:hypothetical protein BSL78_13943 [Apostichopus japonicus]